MEKVEVIKYKSDFDKSAVIANFERRGWESIEGTENDWNIYWATVNTVRNIMNPEIGFRLRDGQYVWLS